MVEEQAAAVVSQSATTYDFFLAMKEKKSKGQPALLNSLPTRSEQKICQFLLCAHFLYLPS